MKRLAIALGLIIAAPLCANAAPKSASHDKLTSAALADLAASAGLIDEWRDYALASLRPDFAWATDITEPIRAPSIFERGRGRLLPPASHFNGGLIESTPFRVALSSSRVSDTPTALPASGNGLLASQTPGLQRYLVAPSVSQRIGSFGAISVSAIFAYQHFADVALTAPTPTPFADFNSGAPASLRTSDTSSGAGLRIDYTGALSESVSWQAGVQSRINMDPLENYRGVYAEPGTFDMPASANIGFNLAVTPQLRLDADVERIMYGQVTPFTSSALPSRFLALLSSSVSPVFAWENLDVYSVGATWRDGANDVSFRYSTREQPLPTSALLAQALPTPSARNYQLGFGRTIGDRSRLRLLAAYAPMDFVLGLPLSYSVSRGGNQMQWEALWITNF